MKMKQTQKRMEEVAKLLEEGYTSREISSLLGLGYSTVARYRTLLDSNKSRGAKSGEKYSTNTQEPIDKPEVEDVVRFLNNSYEISSCVIDGETMLAYEDFITALELEGYSADIVKYSDIDGARLVRTKDLIYTANKINDYIFTEWLKNRLFNEDVFLKYYGIIYNLKRVDDLIQELSEHYSAVTNYNYKQQDILHKIEDADEDTQLLELSKELLRLRKIRRVESNEITLAKQMREYLGSQRIHSRGMYEVANRLENILKDLKEGKYIPRSNDEVEDEITEEIV